MLILAIESSCDELGIALIQNGKILANVISSQIDKQKIYGGVIPELAARLHLENINFVIDELNSQLKIDLRAVDYIAYTSKPGLIGSLLVGKLIAEAFADYFQIPIIGVDHIEGHIFAAAINHDFTYPVLAMVVSGGHTDIRLLKSAIDIEIIGGTRDDAVGECYDKVGRILNLEYPAGPKIDTLAQLGKPTIKLPKPLLTERYEFSFSGLKTSCLNFINNAKQKNASLNLEDFCCSFQSTVVELIYTKFKQAISELKPKTITLVGGVSANSALRKMMLGFNQEFSNLNIIIPKLEYCTDNAAMIAKRAEVLLNGPQ